jgi:N-acetylglucosaminyl-diphospho-decaprenol L-rhamnosyltransferase
MKFDVVVVAYRSEADIEPCLAAVRDEPALASVTVVDNGDGRSAAIAERLDAQTVYAPDNPGFGTAVNRGAAHGTAEAILVLNPDARLQRGAIARGLSRLETDPMIGAVQGAIVNTTTGCDERSAGREIGLVHLAGRAFRLRGLLAVAPVRSLARRVPALADHVERRPVEDQTVESLAATAILLRRSAFEEIGGFDERYFLYGEDLDLCHRMRGAGWRLVAAPETWAVHESGASAETTWDRELRWWEGTLQFACMHWSGARRAGAAVVGAFEAAVLTGRAPSRFHEVVHAARGLKQGTDR